MSERDFNSLLAGSFDATRQTYLQAVAAELLGEDAVEDWRAFRDMLARAYVLAGLLGLDAAWRRLRGLGASPPPPDRRPLDPATFQRERFDFSEIVSIEEFYEAVEGFRERVPVLRDEWDRLVQAASALSRQVAEAESAEAITALGERSIAINRALREAFFASDVDLGVIVNLKELVAEAIVGGLSAVTDERGKLVVQGVKLPEFIQRAELAGAQNLTEARLETIYRNNLRHAFNEGQVRALTSIEAREVAPLMFLSNPRDRRSRGNPTGLYPDQGFHFQMHGYVNTADEFIRLGIVPPNGHNCRCGIRPVTTFEAFRLGITDRDGNLLPDGLTKHNGVRQNVIDRGDYPDRGWISRPLAA